MLFRSVDDGKIKKVVDKTVYNIIRDYIAERTYDESGHYVVRDFRPDIRESLNDGINNGVFDAGATTDGGETTSDDLLAIHLTPGKAYVGGYEIEKNAPTFVDLPKPRTTENVDSAITPIEVGNTVKVENVFNTPDVTPEISGKSVAYAIFNLEDRGRFFIGAGEEVYQGMVIGEHTRDNDLDVNPLKGKKLTNVRASGSDEAVKLTTPVRMNLEQAISYINDDELVEVTPTNIRLRKVFLDPHERKRNQKIAS